MKKYLVTILKSLNISLDKLARPQTDLPLLFHYGRADMTVSFFGANISPTDVNEVIYSLPELSKIVNSYNLAVNEDNEGNKKLIISLEVQKGETAELLDHDKTQIAFFENLSKINQVVLSEIKLNCIAIFFTATLRFLLQMVSCHVYVHKHDVTKEFLPIGK
mgnify:CR=1 FL=1